MGQNGAEWKLKIAREKIFELCTEAYHMILRKESIKSEPAKCKARIGVYKTPYAFWLAVFVDTRQGS